MIRNGDPRSTKFGSSSPSTSQTARIFLSAQTFSLASAEPFTPTALIAPEAQKNIGFRIGHAI